MTVYTNTKIFHFKDKLDSLPKEVAGILPPLHLRIKPTNVCNHRCRYCAYLADNLQLGKDMVVRDQIPWEKMEEIIEDLAAMGVQAVTFSGGGEPFCYPYFTRAIKKLAKTPIKFAALTNGSLLTGEIAELFAEHATWLRVSMDGWDDESYKTYRNVPTGEHAKVMNNIAAFSKLGGKCKLGVSLVVDTKNAFHVYETIKKVRSVGANSIKVSACIVDNDGTKNNAYHWPRFDIVRDQIKEAKRCLADSTFEIYDAYHKLPESFHKSYTWCPYCQILPIIGADLNVYSCQDKAYNQKGLLGSIKQQSFKDFWCDGKHKFLHINPSLDCDHHCVAHTKNELILDYLDVGNDYREFV